MGGWTAPLGIALVSDGLTVLLLIAINVIAFLCTVFSLKYMTAYTGLPKYYSLFMLMVAGMNGVVVSGDLFNLFVFLEIASVASYALVAFGVEADELEAGFKYHDPRQRRLGHDPLRDRDRLRGHRHAEHGGRREGDRDAGSAGAR